MPFGPITTAGACRIAREGDALTVTPLPEEKRFTLRIRWDALPWRLPLPACVRALSEEGTQMAELPVKMEGGEVVLTCEPGVFTYRIGGASGSAASGE